MMRKFFSFCGGLLLPLAFVNAAPVAYSGKVAVNGANFEGEARFKFSFTDANGTVLWSHSSDANASLPVDVVRGHYFVLLGENMNPIPDNLFIDHPAVYLRVHFRSTAEGPFLHLLPDQRIAAAPHALSAEVAKTADSVKPGSVTRQHLAPDVLADLNRTVGRNDLAPDVLADLNRTVGRNDLSPDVLADLNRSIAPGSVSRSMLAPSVQADLNASLNAGSVGAAHFHPDLVKYFQPVLTTQPLAAHALKGTEVVLSSFATGRFLSYQWQKDGIDLPGENNATLVLADLNASRTGQYRVVVSNDFGSVNGEAAAVTVATAAPVITLEGNATLTHEAVTPYVDSGASAADALGRPLTASIVATGSVDVNKKGQNQIKFNVTDAGGNAAAEVTRTVNVVDTTAPVLGLVGAAVMTHSLGSPWQDPGATASDSLDGNLTQNVAVSGSVNVNQAGSYTLAYSVSDASGNAASPLTRTVTVQASGPWTFTNAGATGRTGPTQAQVNGAYAGGSLEGKVTITGHGVQLWTAPATGSYRIEAWGAQGGNATGSGGLGARIRGDFALAAGDALKIVVGQQGSAIHGGGGGGGTFVVKSTDNFKLVIAGGGGGTGDGGGDSGQGNQKHALSTNNGSSGAMYNTGENGQGGSGGGAGVTPPSPHSIHWRGFGGSGYSGNGTDSESFLNGARGGTGYSNASPGGFGGGGGGGQWGAGGGGGYSGGGATVRHAVAGGGGSYNGGANPVNQAGVRTGHGKVIVSFLAN